MEHVLIGIMAAAAMSLFCVAVWLVGEALLLWPVATTVTVLIVVSFAVGALASFVIRSDG